MQIPQVLGSFLTKVTSKLGGLPLSGITRGWWSAQEIIVDFRRAGATSPRTAQRFHPSTWMQERTFAWLLDLEVIRQPAPGRYYVDEERLSIRNRSRIFE